MFVSASRVRQKDRSSRNVTFQSWVIGLDARGRPFAEDMNLLQLLQFLTQTDPAFLSEFTCNVLNIPRSFRSISHREDTVCL